MSGPAPGILSPALNGDVDRGPALTAIWWIFSAIVIITISLRFFTRIKINGLGADDWMMLATVVLFIETACMVTYYASVGGTRHLFYLSPPEKLRAIEFNWLSQPGAIFALFTSKASVALLVLRLIGPNTFWRKYILYFVIVTVFITNSLALIFTFVQCNPVQALWNPTIPANCWDPSVQADYNYFNGAYNVFVDVLLAVLPSTVIMNLNMKLANKLKLCILLGLGLIAAVFAALKVYYLGQLTARSDLTYDTFDVMVWAGTELLLIIVCGSIPTLKPLWDHAFGSKRGSSWSGGKGGGYRSGGSSGIRSKASSHPWSKVRNTRDNTLASQASEGNIPLTDRDPNKNIVVTTDWDVERARTGSIRSGR